MSDGIYDGTGRGNIFRVSMNGDFDVVAWFNGTNGRYPKGSLVKDADGQLYGLAQMGGVFDGGTAFRLTTNHEIKVLASFNQDTGQWPTELTRGADGNFYGTTSVSGGEYIDGTVFRSGPGSRNESGLRVQRRRASGLDRFREWRLSGRIQGFVKRHKLEPAQRPDNGNHQFDRFHGSSRHGCVAILPDWPVAVVIRTFAPPHCL